MKKNIPWIIVIAVFLLCLLAGALDAFSQVRYYESERRYPVEKAGYCRLAYDYRPSDGMLTCRYNEYFYTFFPHRTARLQRRLPKGIELQVIFEDGSGCGDGCWKRIYFWRK